MSTPENTIWLEAARDNFEEALLEGNCALATDVLADMRDNGFEKEADSLVARLDARCK